VPTQFSIELASQIVRTAYSGVVTAREISDYSARLQVDPVFRPHFSELVTFEGNADIRLSYLDWKSLAGLDPFSSTSKHAFVVDSRTALRGAIRMYQSAKDDTDNIRIFEAVDEALAWLSAIAPLARAEGR
jgi:hypothetical protein